MSNISLSGFLQSFVLGAAMTGLAMAPTAEGLLLLQELSKQASTDET